ncbi:MAG: hypothetical protein QOC87_749 [Actinomycetota bacterium]|jgi:hypothetical protein|nr:hypothetical protein [Actinomycetota bacterium]
MFKKMLVLATTLALTAGVPVGSHAGAAQRGFLCSLAGTAKFSPGLSATATDGKYTFTGTLSNCQSTDSSMTSATVKAAGGGSVSCATGTTTGTAVIKWSNHKTTAVSITTTDVAAGVQVTATVTKSNEAATPVGDKAYGVLAFNADATKCNSGGIDSATFQGLVGGGSPS